MTKADYTACVDTLRLADGALFPIPITLDVSSADIENLSIASGARIALRDPRDDAVLAIITGWFSHRLTSGVMLIYLCS